MKTPRSDSKTLSRGETVFLNYSKKYENAVHSSNFCKTDVRLSNFGTNQNHARRARAKNNIFSRTYRELAIVFENEIYDCFFHRELIIIANCLTQVLIIGWLPFQKDFFS